jgi:putative endopeptidase
MIARAVLRYSAIFLLGLTPSLHAQERARPEIGAWGVDTSSMSKTVRPGDDFYRYVNEGWLRTAKTPPGLPAIDGFTTLYLRNQDRVRDIILSLGTTAHKPRSPEQQIADMYRLTRSVTRARARRWRSLWLCRGSKPSSAPVSSSIWTIRCAMCLR